MLVAVFAIALAMGLGCQKKEEPVVDSPASVEPAVVVTPAPALEVEELTPEEAGQLAKIYSMQAKKEITEDNAQAVMAALEREIEADLASLPE